MTHRYKRPATVALVTLPILSLAATFTTAGPHLHLFEGPLNDVPGEDQRFWFHGFGEVLFHCPAFSDFLFMIVFVPLGPADPSQPLDHVALTIFSAGNGEILWRDELPGPLKVGVASPDWCQGTVVFRLQALTISALAGVEARMLYARPPGSFQ